MRICTSLRSFAVGFAACVTLAASPAYAALDEVLAGPEVRTVELAGHALKVRERGDVKELADAHGKVAAVSWRGFLDLHELLGTHYAEYEHALKTARHGLHFVHVVTPEMDVSIVSYGAMRHGSVTLTKRLPEGVTIDAVR